MQKILNHVMSRINSSSGKWHKTVSRTVQSRENPFAYLFTPYSVCGSSRLFNGSDSGKNNKNRSITTRQLRSMSSSGANIFTCFLCKKRFSDFKKFKYISTEKFFDDDYLETVGPCCVRLVALM